MQHLIHVIRTLKITSIAAAMLSSGCQTTKQDSSDFAKVLPVFTFDELVKKLESGDVIGQASLTGYLGGGENKVLYASKSDALNSKVDIFSTKRIYCIDVFFKKPHFLKPKSKGDLVEVPGEFISFPFSFDNIIIEHDGIRIHPNCQFSVDGMNAIYFVSG